MSDKSKLYLTKNVDNTASEILWNKHENPANVYLSCMCIYIL